MSLFLVLSVMSSVLRRTILLFCVSADVSGNEWRTRYETQVELNGQLERQISLIRERLEDIRGNPVGKFPGFENTLLWKHVHYVAGFSQAFISSVVIFLLTKSSVICRNFSVQELNIPNTWSIWEDDAHVKIGNLGGKHFMHLSMHHAIMHFKMHDFSNKLSFSI